ncbi:hypothetical protein PSAC2689_20442 [Paraburkholderia sacchari]
MLVHVRAGYRRAADAAGVAGAARRYSRVAAPRRGMSRNTLTTAASAAKAVAT